MPDTNPLASVGDARAPAADPTASLIRARVISRLIGEDPGTVRIGRFMLLERIGEGGMGEVFAAFDPELDRRVAIKLLRRDRDDAGVRKRIVREAQAMARLSHPNVAQIFEVGEHVGRTFIAMEFVRGNTLSMWRKRSARSWREVLDVFMQAGRGLAAAHAVGLVHRDFKPDNAIVGNDGRVRVLDFGLARSESTPAEPLDMRTLLPAPHDDALATPITHAGAVMGTPAYMAPEQFLGEDVTAHADQFALCVALWEALFGERPFAGSTRGDLIANVTRGRVREVPKTSEVPAWLRAVVLRGLAVGPADRHPTVDALLAALADDPSKRRRRRLAIAAGVGVLALGAGGWALDHARRVAACADAGASISEVWNDDARERVHASLVGTGAVYAASTWERVESRFDGYAGAWATAREQSCVAATVDGTHAPARAELTTECLDERRDALATAVDRLASSDLAAVRAAVTVAARLPVLDTCADEAQLSSRPTLPADPEQRTRIADLRRELTAVATTGVLGRTADALLRARELLPLAEAEGWAPLHAEALRCSVLPSSRWPSIGSPTRRGMPIER